MHRFTKPKSAIIPKYYIDIKTVLEIIKIIKPFGANNEARNIFNQCPTDLLYNGTCHTASRTREHIKAIQKALR